MASEIGEQLLESPQGFAPLNSATLVIASQSEVACGSSGFITVLAIGFITRSKGG